MESSPLIDSSVLVAFFNEQDPLHGRALTTMLSAPRPLIIHEYIFLETATVLMSRADKKTADAFIHSMLTNADIKILHTSEAIFLLTIKAFTGNKTKQLSFADAALLALSKRYSILTFDDALNRAIKKQKDVAQD